MKNKYTKHIIAVKVIAGRQLLKLVHIAHLKVKSFGELVSQTHKKAVLVKKIIGDLPACIDMDLIVEGKEKRVRFDKIPV
jgi:hypothetical protein